MASAAELAIKLSLQGQQQAAAGLKDVGTSAGTMGTQLDKAGGIAKNFVLGAGLMTAGATMLNMAKAAAEDAASVSRLQQAVINAEGSFEGHAAAMESAVKAGQALAFSDDEVRAGLSMLVVQTGSADEAIRRMATAQNLARGAGIDLVAASKLLGKVTDETVGPLQRMGIQIEKGASAQEVLNAVDAKFKGQAATFAASDAGKFALAADKIEETKEQLGTYLLPILVMVADQISTTADSVRILGDSFDVLGDKAGAGGASGGLLSFAKNAFDATSPLGLVNDNIENMGRLLGVVEQESQGFGTVFGVITTAAQGGAAALVDAQIATENLANSTANASDGMRRAIDIDYEYIDALGRQAEAAGTANERNSEWALGIELGSGAAAEAAFALDKLNEAAGRAWEGQQSLTQAWNDATGQVGFWETNVSNAEEALAILTSQGITSGTEFDILTEAVGRYTGGIKDSEGAVVDAAVAQAEFIKKQDELNTKLANGTITQAEYNIEMGKAVGAIDPAAGSAYNLATAQEGVALAVSNAITMVRDLLIELGLLPAEKKTDVSTPGATEAKQHIQDINYEIDQVPSSFTITPQVNLGPFNDAIDYINDSVPHSPAKRGPLSQPIKWDWIFQGIPESAAAYTTQATQLIAANLGSGWWNGDIGGPPAGGAAGGGGGIGGPPSVIGDSVSFGNPLDSLHKNTLGNGQQNSSQYGGKSGGPVNVAVYLDSEPIAAAVSRRIMPAPSIVGV